MSEIPPLIVGTAGHVDHGKTALVRALTGQDTDRLPEEKRRGISIDLGFASFHLPGGREVGLVDVPGHERFIRNMVAGASGMDLVMLVVAADEGVMPQTREHLDILELLGVQAGVVVITKRDLVEPEWLDMVAEEVRTAVAGSFLAGAPMVAVSAVTGEGLEGLKRTLEDLAPAVTPKDPSGFVRLPVDRVFTVAGFGTVVTGTLFSGSAAVEDRLELLPSRRPVRVRQVQVHGRKLPRALAGQRVALNLAGVDKDEVRRGDVLVTPGTLSPCDTFGGRLRLLASGTSPGDAAPRALSSGARVRLHVGTAEAVCRVLLLDREELSPGESCFVQFKMERGLAVARGDHFIVRRHSPVATVGGGVVIAPGRRFKRFNPEGLRELAALESGDPQAVVEAMLGGERPLTGTELSRRAGLAPAQLAPLVSGLAAAGRAVAVGGEAYLSAAGYGVLRERVAGLLREFHRRSPLRRGMPREEVRVSLWPDVEVKTSNALLQRMEEDGLIGLDQEVVTLAGWRPTLTTAQEGLARALEAAYRAAGLSPPTPAEAVAAVRGSPGGAASTSGHAEVFNLLVDQGVLVKVAEGMYFHREAMDAAVAAVRRHLEERGAMTMAEMRDLFGTTRKYAVPLGEYFDRLRLTRRVGDERRLA